MTDAPATPSSAPKRMTFAVAGFFSLLPSVAVGGAIALPALVALAALIAFHPPTLHQAIEKNVLFIALAGALVALLAISSLWSPYVGIGYLKLPLTVGMGLLCAAVFCSPRFARLTLAGALAALIVLITMLVVEATWGTPLNRAAAPDASAFALNQNPARGAVIMLALIWPALAWLVTTGVAWRWIGAATIVTAAGFTALQFGQASNTMGFVIGAAFFGAALITPRLAILAPSFGLAIWMLIAPFVTPLLFGPTLPDWLPHSWAVRISIWRYTSARIFEQPWFGHGLDAGRASTEVTIYDGEPLRVIPLHPHSATMQIWYDSGAIGALLAAALITFLGVAAARAYAHNRLAAAAAAAVLAMFGAMANIGWSAYQEWWLATIMLAGSLVAAVGAEGVSRQS